jgi:N-acetylneuraminic acid mutarotase
MEWEQIASLPSDFQTHHSFAFSIGDYGYIVAGNSPDGNRKEMFKYDPQLDEWIQMPDYPGIGRGYGIGDVYEGKAYMGFGNDVNGDYLNDLWVFDPVDESWTQLAFCACETRIHPAMVSNNGKIYVGMGGGENSNLNDWWEYDIETDSWSQKSGFPGQERHHPFQFSIDEYVFTGFGHGPGFISNNWYRYDPADDSWLQVSNLPGQGRVAGTQFSFNGKGYVLSGEDESHRAMVTGEFWEYDPIQDAWNVLPPHPGYSRWAPASFLLNGEIYIINGVTREANGPSYYVTENYKFNLNEMVSSRNPEVINGQLSLYPNPTNGEIFIKSEIDLIESPYFIFDTYGKIVQKGVLQSGNSSLNTSQLNPGMYQLKVQTEKINYVERFIKS